MAALVADNAPNALAVGRQPADTTIVVTSGLIEKLRDDPAVVETLSPSTAPLWFEPIPHGRHWPIEEYENLALTPRLDERLAHLDERLTTP